MLPRFAGVVPMEAKLGQNASHFGGLPARKLNPDPFADDFRQLKELWRLAFKEGQQLFGFERAIRRPAARINLPQTCSAEWFGTVLES
jgi:hypothetical protein